MDRVGTSAGALCLTGTFQPVALLFLQSTERLPAPHSAPWHFLLLTLLHAIPLHSAQAMGQHLLCPHTEGHGYRAEGGSRGAGKCQELTAAAMGQRTRLQLACREADATV
jgi:hypothetical protein